MATIRHHTRIDRAPDDVWKVIGDPGAIGLFMPDLDSVTVEGATRTIVMNGLEIVEEVVTADDELRRFQYRITGGVMVPEQHLATIDVLPDGDGSLLIYSADVKPDDVKPILDAVLAGAVAGIKAHLES